ncbi:XIRP1 protein, partial [Atractosteus spatula]|nr:XIRP1 protein [Atractosteus spatula]
MADKTRKIKVSAPSNGAHVEDNLPPPPPHESVTFVPVPPPKETFSTFYQQRQKNELKRLYRHMHPELRKNLEDVVNQDLVEVLSSEDTQASVETGYQGEVQSMRWIFENWALDSIGDPHATKKMLEEEAVMGGNVKGTSSVFEHQDSDSMQISSSVGANIPVRGDVHAAAWLFETQPLDSLNKIHPEEGDMVEAVLKETVQRGDVKGAKLLFESYPLDALGRCNSVEDHSFLKLKSEIHEQKGDVQTTVKLFETEPCCAIRDSTGNIHKVTSICREEIQSSSVRSARWLFETQPFDVINQKESGVQIIRGISLEEDQKGGVERMRWMFETQPLDTIHESTQEPMFQATTEQVEGADVGNKWHLFETQPLASLKGEFSDESRCREEIVGGAVRSTLWLFETQPMENLKDSYEVGRLQKITVTDEERGTVQNRKHVFETCTLDTINKELTEGETKGDNHEIEKGDVKSYKHLFETIPLGNISQSEDESVEKCHKVIAGNVKSSRALFQTTPLYAIKDCSGNYYEVTTVSREQIVHGNVQKYKWMFETRPLDQFEEGKVEIIRGITKQEDQTGDVKSTKWLFETQSLDRIHSQVNQTEKPLSNQRETLQSGNVKTCRWLFETQPMDILYEKSEKKQEEETLPKTDVKSYTWLFETQPLDTLNDLSERHLKLCNTSQDGLKTADVKTERHVFETEDLDSTGGTDGEKEVRYVSQVDVQSGDVSRVKEIFETKSLDEIGTASVKISEALDDNENIQRGSVRKFTWLFENCPIDAIKEPKEEEKNIKPCSISEVEGGNVGNKRFIFETFSLDQIHDEDQMLDHTSVSVKEHLNKGDVKSCTMLFETQPLYAITDKDGQFHEVTTVKKEEIISGDVRGARWMFETKPLDTIKPQDEIFVIRAVTQEDVLKGDVKTARWRFETQPLSSLTSQDKTWTRTVDDVQKGDVKFNKELFESQEVAQKKYVRMVSVTDAQHGDVRTSTWLFENQPIDSLKGELQEKASVPTVHREDNQKGDVKRCTWLFETQPLDSLKDSEPTANRKVQEEVPLTDGNVQITKLELSVNQPLSNITLDAQFGKDDVAQAVESLLNQDKSLKKGILIQETERGHAEMTVYSLYSNHKNGALSQEIIKGDVKSTIGSLLASAQETKSLTTFKLEENEKGNVNLYRSCIEKGDLKYLKSLQTDASEDEPDSSSGEQTEILQGDVKGAKKHLNQQNEQVERTVVDIVPGDVKNVKKVFSSERGIDIGNIQKEEIICGDVSSAKQSLGQASNHPTVVEKEEIVSGDIKATLQALERAKNQSMWLERETVVPGKIYDLNVELQETPSGIKKQESKQTYQVERRVVMEDTQTVQMKETTCCSRKESATSTRSEEKVTSAYLKVSDSVEMQGTSQNFEACQESKVTQNCDTQSSQEKTETEAVVRGDVKAAIKSLQSAATEQKPVEKEDIVRGNLQAALQSLEKSNINVSKGDFKAAMIYRNAGQSYSECRKKKDTTSVCNQSVFISVPPSDAELSPPVSVTDGEQQPPATVSKATITSSNKDETANKPLNSSNLISNSEIPPPLPLKTCEKLTTQKPALPPKPEPLNKGPCGAPASRPVPPPKPQNLREKQHTPVIPIKVKRQLPAKPKQDTGCENIGFHAAYIDTKKEHLTEIDKTLQFVDLNKENKEIQKKDTVEELQSAAKAKIPTCKVIEKNKSVPQSINAVEEIRGYMQCYSENSEIKNEMNQGFQTALQNFDDKKKGSGQLSSSAITKKGVVVTAPPLPKKAKVIQNEEKKEISKSETNTCLKQRTTVSEQNGTYSHGQQQNSQHRPSVEVSFSHRLEEQQEQPESKVVLREKKGRRETEDERRQRLSVHKDEIMRGNVKAAMEIFENLRKREELKIILSKVEEIEGETCKVDVRYLKNLFENVPEWVVGPGKSLKNNKPKGEQKVEKTETLKDDTESMSSVEVVFGDLERASVEITNLKEQTLARLMDIEEAIKKALYSVSNLKSESDIAGLSGLFKESLGTEQNSVTPNNIRKISIVSSKAKLEHSKETFGNNTNENILLSEKTDKVEKTGLEAPVIKPNSPSSPSYISIQSAARKPTEPPNDCINSKPECEPKNTHGTNGDPDKCSDLSQQEALSNVYSPLSPRRQKSVLEVKTVPEAAGIVGTKTVMEKYEETDCFGNKFVTSKTSTIVTKQSETKTSSSYEVVASPTRYEVMTSPRVRRSAHHFSEGPQSNCKVKEGGTVFVTFGHPKTGGKH